MPSKYQQQKRLLITDTDATALNILAVGCTGKEPNILAKMASSMRGIESDTRGQVALGMQLTCQAPTPQTDNIVILLGDLVYDDGVDTHSASNAIASVEEHVIAPYQDIQASIRVALGNHEVSCHGKGQSFDHATAKGHAFVEALRDAQGEVKQFVMPDTYYAEIIRSSTSGKILSFVIYADTNLLPADPVQQQWLQDICAEFQALDPDNTIPWLFAGHHTLAESVDKRGTKGNEGKKYANRAATSGNQHQLVNHTLVKLGLPIERFIVLAAHIHDTSIKIRDADNAIYPEPLVTAALGGGGSHSNKGNMQAFVSGLVFSEKSCGAGRVEISDQQTRVSFLNCALLDLSSDAVQMPTTQFSLTVNSVTKAISHEPVFFDPILLKRQKDPLQFLHQALSNDAPFLLSWYLLQHHREELTACDKALQDAGERPCFAALLELATPDQTFTLDVITHLKHSIAHCLHVFHRSLSTNGPASFIKLPKAYKTLQSYHVFLSQLDLLLAKGLSPDAILETLQDTLIKHPEEPACASTRGSLYIMAHADELESDDEEEEETKVDALNTTNPLLTDQVLEQSLTATKVNPLTTIQNLTSIKQLHVGTRKLAEAGITQLSTFIVNFIFKNPEILQQAIQQACVTYLEHLHQVHYQLLDQKKFPALLLPFLAARFDNIALLFTVHVLAKTCQPEALVASLMALQVIKDTDFCGMIFNYLAKHANDSLNADFTMSSLASFLRAQSHELYPDASQGAERQHASMKAILIDAFQKLAFPPTYQDFLTADFQKALWANAFWEKLLIQAALPKQKLPLLQAVYQLWMNEKNPSLAEWLSQKVSLTNFWSSSAPTPRRPIMTIEMIAELAIRHATTEEYLTELRELCPEMNDPQALANLIVTSADFTAFKKLLARGDTEGWLIHLPDLGMRPSDVTSSSATTVRV